MPRRLLEGVSICGSSVSSDGALLSECWRDCDLETAIPGKWSPLMVSARLNGVGLGSTDTTDRIGKTRSLVVGLDGPNGESEEFDGGEVRPCRPWNAGFRVGIGPSKPKGDGSADEGDADVACSTPVGGLGEEEL